MCRMFISVPSFTVQISSLNLTSLEWLPELYCQRMQSGISAGSESSWSQQVHRYRENILIHAFQVQCTAHCHLIEVLWNDYGISCCRRSYLAYWTPLISLGRPTSTVCFYILSRDLQKGVLGVLHHILLSHKSDGQSSNVPIEHKFYCGNFLSSAIYSGVRWFRWHLCRGKVMEFARRVAIEESLLASKWCRTESIESNLTESISSTLQIVVEPICSRRNQYSLIHVDFAIR